jgi:hypothetical protein
MICSITLSGSKTSRQFSLISSGLPLTIALCAASEKYSTGNLIVNHRQLDVEVAKQKIFGRIGRHTFLHHDIKASLTIT